MNKNKIIKLLHSDSVDDIKLAMHMIFNSMRSNPGKTTQYLTDFRYPIGSKASELVYGITCIDFYIGLGSRCVFYSKNEGTPLDTYIIEGYDNL